MDVFQTDIEFKKNVGDFILTFSEIEFSLGVIFSKLEVGIDINPLNPKYFGASFEEKRKNIRKLLIDNKPLFTKWEKIDSKISICNDFRRSIAHGIVMNHIVNPSIQTLVKHKNGFRFKELTIEDVVKHLKILYDINSGKLGLGVFTEELNEWINNSDNK
jgi:hypothetical protein